VTPNPSDAGTERFTEGTQNRWSLEDEREFLQRSLDDADREHQAGDLSDGDHAALITRDRGRLRDVEAALERLGPAPASADGGAAESAPMVGSPRSGWRQIGVVGCCVLMVVGVVILVVHATQTRQPGQSSSGSISQSQAQLIEQQLGEAQTFQEANQTLAALELYNKVLSEDPSDPDALANAGWLQWKSGFADDSVKVMRTGRTEVQRAVRIAPLNADAHLYLGVILINQDDNAAGAQKQFALFLSDAPPPAEVHAMAGLIGGVYTRLGLPVPSELTAPTTTTTSSTP
jgi:hypothetical protein